MNAKLPVGRDPRARQYAVCVWVLRHDPETEGAAALFDQALTNGLAAIVGRRWPNKLNRKDGRVKSAAGLLDVVGEQGIAIEAGVRALPHGDPDDLWIETPMLGPDPVPNFTEVRVALLRDGIAVSQAIRHGRAEGEPRSLTLDHIQALEELDHDPALFALSDEAIDRAELAAASQDAEELDRAHAYRSALAGEEWQRRCEIDYRLRYGALDPKEELPQVQECPACDLSALVAEALDSYLGEIGVGQCVACSYRRRQVVADDQGLGEALRRAAHE